MPQCAFIGIVQGEEVLVPAHEPQCTGLVVLTPDEYAHITNNPFNLTYEQGAIVAGAVATTWLIGWSFKALIAVLRNDGEALED
jgi:hypothetical protein